MYNERDIRATAVTRTGACRYTVAFVDDPHIALMVWDGLVDFYFMLYVVATCMTARDNGDGTLNTDKREQIKM